MPVNFVNIPDVLKQTASFCVWKMEKRSGRPTKVPYNPRTGAMARTNDPSTFADFNTAMKSYAIGGWVGIGYRVSEGIGAIDIDHCIRDDGSLNDVAASILGIFPDVYFEKSPSGTGLRGFFKLSPDFAYDKTVYYINNRKHGLEVYLPGVTNRFVTVTGDMFRNGAVTRNDDALRTLLDTFMKRSARVSSKTVEPASYLDDDGVIAHASASESGDKFKALYAGNWEEGYDSQSDADMALVSILAFWCGNVEEQIDRIFRTSGLMRDKWDRMTGDSTYGQITIRNAVSTNSEIYTPIADSSAEDDFEALDDEEEAEVLTFEPDLSHITLTIEEMRPHTKPRYQRDEIGIGYAFADYFKPIARFDRERGIWYVYDGKVWQPDENALAVAELAKILADRLYSFALQITDEDTRNRYIKRVQKLQMRKNRRTMIEDAKSVYPVSHTVFDRNTDLFNCQNGTLNLTTGEFRPHDPADFLTMMSGITYDPDATCPRWEQFISEVMMNDADLALYLQKALGYALTGDTSLECLFILYGATSRNGKGTTMETFLKIMGDYGKTSNPEMLSTKFGNTNASGPSEEIARLAGVRFVNISEPEKKITFNAALVKRMTGNDTLNARFLHENSFDFRPNFKIFINTNYKPSVSDMTLFYSNRLKLIPFKRHFEEHEQDKGLKAFFAAPEIQSAIFNWCYEGYKLFRKQGLDDPTAVSDATREYQEESDRIGQFVAAWLVEGEAFEVRTSAVYKLYGEWCDKYGYRKENSTNFNNAIQRFFPIVRKRPSDGSGAQKTTMLVGCRFLEHENGEVDEVEEFAALE
ncbi:phage/plasmid primase, P4 family [Ruminococcus sp.]|uniref:phage/plasmid primase, P4 family n=1 Tax=Ruminococcus sp. TaxID=41978 RepID=UPI0025EE8A3F|nr:phage/plasmid primase, P4 family [Ruminococcus sp.]MBQ4465366.1 nucleoside triphosphatase [Oscillospiraceae bacterium]MBQ6250139.1 nucleoside triphosphatase [Ruminococcus sp.]